MPLKFSTLAMAIRAGLGIAPEGVEHFFVTLSNPVNATLANNQGQVSITRFIPVAINSVIRAARITGVAPLNVHFDTIGTTASGVARPFHHVGYSWDFGDPAGGATWQTGAVDGSSKNTAFGPVAAHVFETPGTYTVTLTTYYFPEGRGLSVDVSTVTIVVEDPETVFATHTFAPGETDKFLDFTILE